MTILAEMALYNPLIDNCPFGPEPELEFIIKQHYLKYFSDKDAQELTDKYIVQVDKYFKEKFNE